MAKKLKGERQASAKQDKGDMSADVATKATTHSPTQVAKVPPYLSINPGLFDSVDHWSYRDLQKLAKRLQLPSNGKRAEIVERLQTWHREQRGVGQPGQFQAVQVRATPEGKAISPRLLSPLVQRQGSERKSGILSSKRIGADGDGSDRSATAQSPAPLQQRGGVLFSPYNLIRLIPSKEHSEMVRRGRTRAPPRGPNVPGHPSSAPGDAANADGS